MKVSIITVCFNSAETIQNTFDSIRNQTYNNIELIVIDGASNDGTLDIIESNKDIISKMVSEPDQGLYDAMNKGVNIANGDIVAILNSDDIFPSDDVIANVINKFQETNCDILYGNINYKNKKGETVRIWDSSPYLKGSFFKGWHPPHPSLFIKKSVYDRCGLFDTDFKIAADFEFMLRVYNF